MRLRFLIGSLLFGLASAMLAGAQGPGPEEPKPVTIQQIRRALRFTPETPEHIEKTNNELIQMIKARGVDFALSKEEEWALTLQNASDDLVEAIRAAVSAEEHERLLKVREQEGLYYAFVNNYARNDVTSRRIAVDAGREFVRKYRGDANVAEIVSFLQRAVPALERSIRYMDRPAAPVRVPGRRRTN
jgi:hypothetical protein